MRKLILLIVCSMAAFLSFAGNDSRATVIIQVSDPQMGFYHGNRDMEYETEMLIRTVEAINRIQPDAVVFTGDYVHNPLDSLQWKELLRITSAIHPSIRLMYLPGNHDVLRNKGAVDMTPYLTHLGADRFSLCINNVLLTGLNSNYVKDETHDPSKEREQLNWLKRSLKKKKRNQVSLVFDHHPFFLQQIDEPEGYSTIAPEKRLTYFSLFKKYGVGFVFSGHLHDNAETSYDNIQMVTTSATGRQLGKAESGVRVIIVRQGEVSHRYYPIGDIPNNRDEILNN